MPEKKKKEEEVEGILSDLDAIFTGGPAAAPAKPAPAAEVPPAEERKPEPPAEETKPAPAPLEGKPEPPPPPPPPPPPEPVEAKPEPAAVPVVEEKPAPETPPSPPPLEEKSPPPEPVEAKPEPAAVPVVEEKPAPETPPSPPPTPEPAAPGGKPARPKEVEIGGKKVPYEQVRRVAFIYSAGEKKAFEDFIKFFVDIAQKVSKKPLYVDPVLSVEWSSGIDAGLAVDKAKQAGAVAAVCLMSDDDKDSIGSDLQEAGSRADIFLRVVAISGSLKRSTAVDLVVDLMLVDPA